MRIFNGLRGDFLAEVRQLAGCGEKSRGKPSENFTTRSSGGLRLAVYAID
jgi:hypothetical protein